MLSSFRLCFRPVCVPCSTDPPRLFADCWPTAFRLPHTSTPLTLQYLTLPEVCWVSGPEDQLRAPRSPMAQVSASQMQNIITSPKGAPPKFQSPVLTHGRGLGMSTSRRFFSGLPSWSRG